MNRSRFTALVSVGVASCAIGSAGFARGNPVATITGKDGARMVLVPAGRFVMGASPEKTPAGDRIRNEDQTPPHEPTLPAFYIDRCEVTNAQYARYLAATGAPPPITWNGPKAPAGKENHPVTNVSWFDAMRYAIWAGKRLPTEAEWEKAARGTDGRRFPWGNDDDPARRNLAEEGKLRPVGQLPAGASPFGCMDMSGNAWEWTADWYAGYPETTARSPHFGRQYKVMRGGGAIYFYGIDNAGSCIQRARLVPYGDHDGLGFRCVQDVPGAPSPYDPKKVLAEAEDLLKATLREPAQLSYEVEYAEYLKAGTVPLRVVGAPNQAGAVSVGVPFPAGLVKDPGRVVLLDSDGEACPAQTRTLSSWKDGTARWALFDFAGRAGRTYQIDFRRGDPAPAPRRPIRISRTRERIEIDTGAATFAVTPDALIRELKYRAGTSAAGPLGLSLQMVVAGEKRPVTLRPLPADTMELEDGGPLRCCVRLRGSLGGAGPEAPPFRYDLRVQAVAGSPRVNLLLTLTHLAKRLNPPEKVAPVAQVTDASLMLSLPTPPREAVFGTDRGTQAVPAGKRIELDQPDDLRYAITADGRAVAGGTRAPGWVALRGAQGWIVFGLRHFWQNHAKTLFVTPEAAGVRLWAGAQPFEWEAGLAKTHEIVLDFASEAPAACVLDPLRAAVPPAWACGTEAVGPMLPRSREAVERFPYWELLRESAKRRWVRSMPTGLRDFGDAYMGGPYKGKNAYSNLEYDVPFNFLLDFLKTGQTWYLDAAEAQARHQADIDIDHFDGRPWKHSPQHTTTEADLGHVFVRGLILHYLLTGERRSLEAARETGDWLAPRVAAAQGIGNERQIGWSLYALSALYEHTGDEKYLKAAAAACDKLIAGQAPSGKFNIRWDNRISFFNGIAMNGMLSVHRFTGNEALAEAVLRVARRTLGFYPEYACRTLDAFAWAAQRTKDPRYLDVLERTWISSMEFLMGRDSGVSEEVHAWQFTRLAAKYGLFPLFDRTPDVLPDAASWRGFRLAQDRAELFIRNRSSGPAALLVVLEGTAEGTAELLDPSGKVVERHGLAVANRFFQAATLAIPAGASGHRLRLAGTRVKAWQIHHDQSTHITLHDPALVHVADLYPRAYGYREPGAAEVRLDMEVAGEGFHSATLYDPDGNPVASVRRFVDFEDPKTYTLTLQAKISDDRTTGWALEIYGAKIVCVRGLRPYWAAGVDELFTPDESAAK